MIADISSGRFTNSRYFQKRGWFINERCPNAERIARRGFYLPSGVGLTEEEADMSAQRSAGNYRHERIRRTDVFQVLRSFLC